MVIALSGWRGLVCPAVAAWAVSAGFALAQGQPAQPRPRPAETARPAESAMKPGDMLKSPADPVVGIVEGHLIYLSDIGHAVAALPENLRGLPFDMLFPVALDRIIDHQALVAMARRQRLDEDPAVRRDIQAATDRILEAALLAREAAPGVTEEKIQERYARQYSGKLASEETRARHILVATEGEAKKLIAALNKGADFATLAREHSKDPDRENGGDLGFFRRDQVGPDFADVAFAMIPGQVTQTPIRNEFGWHVVKVEERRLIAPPGYAEVRDALRQVLLQEAIQRTIDQAKEQLSIRKFNLDGSLPSGTVEISPAQPIVRPQDAQAKQ